MSNDEDERDPMSAAALSDEEERRERANSLSREIAHRYDPARLSKIVVSQAGRGERLDLDTMNEMERRIGGRFSDVRIIRGPFAEAITKHHRADAVTVANTGLVLVREGPRADFRTRQGKALLAHELTHVKQAQRGLHFAHTDDDEGEDDPGEDEARAVESNVYKGLDDAQKNKAKVANQDTAENRRRDLMERVLNLINEDDRITRMRLGIDD